MCADFDLLLEEKRLSPSERSPIDADVTIGKGDIAACCRLVLNDVGDRTTYVSDYSTSATADQNPQSRVSPTE